MLPRKTILPFAKPDISEKEIESVKEVLLSGWLTTGRKTEEFEEALQSFCNVKYAIVLNSATAGLHLALRAFDIKKGDSIIVPAFTFTATAEVVFRCNAIPLLVDVDRNSYMISKEIIKNFIEQYCEFKNNQLIHLPTKTIIRGILCVHYGGRVCDIDSLKEIAKQYNLFLGEDAAHAFGSMYKNKKIGGLTDFSVFSFYATKNITTGEGGALTTNHKTIANKIRKMRLHGFDIETYKRKKHIYDVVTEGYKYNISDILSAIGLAQFNRHYEMLNKRKRIHEIYQTQFKKLDKIKLNPEEEGSSYHLYTIEISRRDEFIKYLNQNGIQTGIHFKPLYRMTYYKNKKLYNINNYPNCEEIYKNILSLPIYSAMSEEDIQDVVDAVTLAYENLYLKKNRKRFVLPFLSHK
ncbi:MAG: pyridoxal phosphate-dependent aminotransferase [Leptospiraceae bacterium]|nr:MAG: pyridoxal phosphate-dependent aminotransferase [Leptospiraceae bacterium]